MSKTRLKRGAKIGRLTLRRIDPKSRRQFACGQKTYSWICKCDCGKTVLIARQNLRVGHTESCGCNQRQKTRLASTTHGMSKTTEYEIWSGIKQRCYNKNHKRYRYYGGRGIVMCDEWRNSFPAFFAAVGHRPSQQHSLDRYPNNDGNYELDNIRWATRQEQMSNTRRSHLIEFRGQKLSVSEWERQLGFSKGIVQSRLDNGWTDEEALVIPNLANRKKLAAFLISRSSAPADRS